MPRRRRRKLPQLSSSAAAVALLVCVSGAVAQVPSLDDLAGEWMLAARLRDTPAISNWAGSVATNLDIVDVSSFISPPFVAGPSMLTMRIDGWDVPLEATRWSVFQAARKGRVMLPGGGGGGRTLAVMMQLRMVFNDSALLWKISLENERHGSPSADETVSVMAANSSNAATMGPGSGERNFTLQFDVQAQARKLESMGWLIHDPPQTLTDFTTVLRQASSSSSAMLLHRDSKSDAASGFVFADHQPSAWGWRENKMNPNASVARGLVNLALAPGQSVSLRLVMAMGPSKAVGGMKGMARRLNDYAARFDEHFDAAKSEWERVWAEAFTPPAARPVGQPQLFSGHLPTLHTADEAIRRLYYMGALTLLATGRTSTNAFNDDGGASAQSTYITGFGSTFWAGEDDGDGGGDRGSSDRGETREEEEESNLEVDCRRPQYPRETTLAPVYIGATAQFYWDTSLRALLTSLLDPAALRRYIVRMMSLTEDHFRRSFGLDALNGKSIGYEYAFNAHSIFTIVSTYLRATNDSSLLDHVVDGGATVDQRLEMVALDWVHRRLRIPEGMGRPLQSPFLRGLSQPGTLLADEDKMFFLADYGENLAHFLECLPTYIHATPGLQAGNAEMMGWMSSLRSAQGNATGAQRFRGLAEAIAIDMVQTLYVPGGNGTWGCMYPPDAKLVAVRHVIDFIYVSRGLDIASRAVNHQRDAAAPLLPAGVEQEMAAYFHRELETPTWIRALSLSDELNLRVPWPKLILRPDHGITGAFDAWAALATEALAITERDWRGALAVLRHMSEATKEGPFGQAHELDNSADGKEAAATFKTVRGWTRYTADNGASFSDVIVRGLFGYDPPFLAQHDPGLPFHGLEAAFDRRGRAGPGKDAPRGDLQARLENLATPWGMATLEMGSDGVRIRNLS